MERKISKTKSASKKKIVPSKKKSRSKKMKGEALFQQLVQLTGLPKTTWHKELKTILERKQLDLNHLTLEQLRLVAASYVREIMTNLLEKTRHRKPPETPPEGLH